VKARTWERLISTGKGARQPLIPISVVAIVLLAFVAATPWLLEHVDETRRYIDPGVKRAFFGVSALFLLAVVLVCVVTIAAGLGAIAVLYGRSAAARGSVTLSTPLGCLGVRSRRIELVAGDAAISVRAYPAQRPFYSYGPTTVMIRQGNRSLRVTSLVSLGANSRQRLLTWLERAGVNAVLEGDVSSLP
jgi:hypothetical protein